MAMTKELRVTEIEGRGRAVVAAQPLSGGQIVLRDSPILLYSALPLITPTPPPPPPYCDHCFKILQSQPTSASISACPRCSLHVFCSPNCLSAALSSSHSPWACQALRRLRDCPSPLSDQPLDRQVQARFLVAAYNLALVSPSNFQILLSLQGQPGDSAADTAAAAQFLHSLISSLCPPPFPQEQQHLFSMEFSAALLVKDKLNAFGLMEPPFFANSQRSSRAYAIYPRASFFNHDCLPNACRFDYIDTCQGDHNTDIIIRMIHDVPAGREICLSYFPVNQPYSSRQRTLAEDYGFVCHCDRCKVEANWSDNDENDEAEDEAEGMDEDEDQQMGVASESESEDGIEAEAQAESDFPHAYFFVRFMCNRPNCWGTLAPLPPTDGGAPSNVLECNVCGNLKKDDEEINAHGQDRLSMNA